MMLSSVFGNLPKDWTVKKMDQVNTDFSMGPFGSDIKTTNFVSFGVPVIRGINLSIPPFLEDGFVFLTERKADELKGANAFPNDLVFTHRGTLGQVGVIPKQGKFNRYVISQSQMKCSCIPNTLDSMFAFYFFSSNLGQKMIFVNSSDSGVPHIVQPLKSLRKFLIILPPYHEQIKIAEAISNTNQLIKKYENLIQKKKNIKQGAMQELLTGKRRLEGFSGEWETKRLGDVLNYEQPTAYLVHDTNYDDSYPIPVLTAGKSFILGYTDEEQGIFQYPPVIIFDDFTTDSRFVEFPFKVKSSAMKILKPKNDQFNLKFVFDMMQIINFSIGVHKRYWLSEYQFLEIKIPKLNEQIVISKILSDMDSEIQQLEKQLEKYTNLKQAIMQKLLTGEIRLI